MKVTEAQRLLLWLLKLSGADQDMAVGTLLMLDDNPEATEDLLLWLDEFNPERKELNGEQLSQIIEKTLEYLPPDS